MHTLSAIRTTAAAVTLLAGVLAVAVRFGPMVAPHQHEAAMIQLAAAFGQDIGPAARPAPLYHSAAY